MSIQVTPTQQATHLSIWTALLGAFIVLLGMATIAVSDMATLAVSWVVGIALIGGGIAQLFHASRFFKTSSAMIRFLIAAFTIIAGGLILKTPMVGAIAITLVLALYLIFAAVAKLVLAYEVPHTHSKGTLIFSSIISLFLGCCLLFTFPLSSLFIPGTIVGVDLIFYGMSIAVASVYLKSGNTNAGPTHIRRVA
jgi:uncharacterized membrane protein HdeD (DUF308 family)